MNSLIYNTICFVKTSGDRIFHIWGWVRAKRAHEKFNSRKIPMLYQHLYSCIEWLECQSVGIDTKTINQFRLDLVYKKIGKRLKQNTQLLELSDLRDLFPEHAELHYLVTLPQGKTQSFQARIP